MGSKDVRRRETKKPKKDPQRSLNAAILPPSPVDVEVIKKGKKPRESGEEE